MTISAIAFQVSLKFLWDKLIVYWWIC